MKLAKSVLALVAAFGLVQSVALAGGDGCCKSAAKTTDAKTVGDKAECSKGSAECCNALAAKCMPQMKMVVGEKEFACPVEAGEFAKKNNAKVVYVVANKKFEDQEKAMTTYADVLDEYVATFAKVRTQEECMASCTGAKATCTAGKSAEGCCKSGTKTTGTSEKATAVAAKTDKKSTTAILCVAGRCYECKDKADKASKLASEAMKEVAMKYKVGEKEYCCDKMAGEAVAKAGKDAKMVFVVGKTTTPCKTMARIALAKAKILAAVQATQEKAEKVATKA